MMCKNLSHTQFSQLSEVATIIITRIIITDNQEYNLKIHTYIIKNTYSCQESIYLKEKEVFNF